MGPHILQVPASILWPDEALIVSSFFLPAAMLVAGLFALIVGSLLLIRGGSGLAARMGISPLVIGLVALVLGPVVAGLAVILVASCRGDVTLVVGNIVGSNIFNVLFILGICGLVTPLAVAARLIRWSVPLMFLSSLAVLWLGWHGEIDRLAGAGLLLASLGYVVAAVYVGRRDQEPARQEFAGQIQRGMIGPPGSLARQLVSVLAALGALSFGAYWFVEGTAGVASHLAISEFTVGLSIVGIGTSLPGLITSIAAAKRGDRNVAVGNVVGSYLISSLGFLGIAAMAAPHGAWIVPVALRFDIPVMVAVSVLCVPILFSGCVISRWEGLLFLSCYAAYMAYLVLRQGHSVATEAYGQLIVMVLIPTTVILVMLGGLKAFRRRRPVHAARHRIRGI